MPAETGDGEDYVIRLGETHYYARGYIVTTPEAARPLRLPEAAREALRLSGYLSIDHCMDVRLARRPRPPC